MWHVSLWHALCTAPEMMIDAGSPTWQLLSMLTPLPATRKHRKHKKHTMPTENITARARAPQWQAVEEVPETYPSALQSVLWT